MYNTNENLKLSLQPTAAAAATKKNRVENPFNAQTNGQIVSSRRFDAFVMCARNAMNRMSQCVIQKWNFITKNTLTLGMDR